MAEKNEVRRKFGKYFLANSLLSALLLKGKTVKAGKLPQPKGKIKTKKLQNSIYIVIIPWIAKNCFHQNSYLLRGLFILLQSPYHASF